MRIHSIWIAVGFLLGAAGAHCPDNDDCDLDHDGFWARNLDYCPDLGAELGDCNDADASLHPEAPEICDGVDNNCDGSIDEGLEVFNFYPDPDGDGCGFSDPLIMPVVGCAAPAPDWVPNDDDCDEGDPSVCLGAEEICDGMDNDCDGSVDEDGVSTYFADADGDDFGDPANSIMGCEPGDGYVPNAGDCDDTDPLVHPGAEEACDGIDNDCDGEMDAGAGQQYFADDDGDGFGNPDSSIVSCDPPNGVVSNADDCNDTDPLVHPGAEEVCDGLDNDCDDEIDQGLTCDACTPYDTDSVCLACLKSMCCEDYKACTLDLGCADCLGHILDGTPHQGTCYDPAPPAASALYYGCAAGNGGGTPCADACPINF